MRMSDSGLKPWAAAIVVIVVYLLSIPVLYWQRHRLRARTAEAEMLEPTDELDLTEQPPEG